MSEQAPLVETRQGILRGKTVGEVDCFLGLDFALAPEGPLRFRSPRPPQSWSGVRDAVSNGPVSAQLGDPTASLLGSDGPSFSEDCLKLNLWRPAGGGESLPVMVFIHGGGFYGGSAKRPVYDGARLAANGQVILIVIQYRLGVLGLLAHSGLEDPETGHCGNWAFQDQIAALKWVRENVAAFGGDVENITLFGESAGGGSVALHCVSPVSRPLIRRAIIQSSSPLPATLDMHQEASLAFFDAVDVGPEIDKLQALSTEEILDVQDIWINSLVKGRTAPRPMVDGSLVPDWPDARIDAGSSDGLDIMVTYNENEMSYFATRMAAPAIPSSPEMVKRTLGNLRDSADQLYDAYVDARTERGEACEPFDLWVALRTDRLIRVPAMDFLARYGARGNRAWGACFTWGSEMPLEHVDGRTLGACHVIDLPLVFGTYDHDEQMRRFANGPEVDRVSADVQAAWIAFAKSGDPNCERLPDWPAYSPEKRETMMLGPNSRVDLDPRAKERKAMSVALAAAE